MEYVLLADFVESDLKNYGTVSGSEDTARELTAKLNNAIVDSHSGLITVEQCLDQIKVLLADQNLSEDAIAELIGVDSFYYQEVV